MRWKEPDRADKELDVTEHTDRFFTIRMSNNEFLTLYNVFLKVRS